VLVAVAVCVLVAEFVAVLVGVTVAVAVLSWMAVNVCVGSGGCVDVAVGDEMAVAVEGTVDVLDGDAVGVVVAVGLLQSLVYNKENVLRGLLPPLCETPPAIALPGDMAVTPKRMLVVVPELALLARVH
jgi:hypothetical protein